MKCAICGLLISVVLLVLCGCAPVTMDNLLDEGKKPLSEKQLYELVANNSLHLEAIDFDAKIHYLSNGHLNATSLQGEQDKGRWSVTSDNQLCMKFELWYFGDLKCYNLIEENDKYLYFTTNGARYYTGTKTFGDDSGLENTGPTDSINHAAPKPKAPQATRLSTAEKKRALISLARNCPDCNFSGVDLRGAQLIGANLAGANLSGADLRDANLRRANLTGANLTEADLARINLAGADLTDCNLSDADLSGSNLIRANVTGAILTGAILSGAHLESIQGFKE